MKFLFFVSFLLLGSCTKKVNRPETLEISVQGEVSTIDPALCYDTICYVPVAQIYETLYEYDYLKRPYALRPLIAESFPEISADKKNYRIKIKNSIPYHSAPSLPKGRVVKAQDFINQIKRVAFAPTRSPGWWLFDGKIVGINEWRESVGTNLEKMLAQDIPGLKALNDNQLEIKLTRPYPQLLYALAMNFTSPVPIESIQATQNSLAQESVGTGAYFLAKYHPTQEVFLKRNYSYITSTYPEEGIQGDQERGLLADKKAQLPFIENVRILVMKEAQTEWLNFLKQKIDLINLTKDHYSVALTREGQLKQEIIDQNIDLQISPTLIYWWIAFNMQDPVIGKNKDLRLAIAHGLNIEKYIELFTYNVALKAHSLYPPGISGYNPQKKLPYEYDLSKAKAYLKKAGFPDGKGLPTLTYDVRGTDTRKRQMGEFVAQELKALGINVNVRVNSFPSFLEKSRKGELQFWQGGWVMDYPDAENVLQLLATKNLPPGPNSSQYSNEKFDSLFNEILRLEDGAQKSNLMNELEDIVHQDLPWVMQYYSRNYILSHRYLKNFKYSDIIYNNLKYLKLEGKK